MLSRYLNSYFFVAQAVHNVCGYRGMATMDKSDAETCAAKLAGTPFAISYVTIGSELEAENLAQ